MTLYLLLDKDKNFLLTKFTNEIYPIIAFIIILICIIALFIQLALKEYVPSKKLLFFTFLVGIVTYQTALAKEHILIEYFVYAHIITILFLCQLGLLISHLIKQFEMKMANENRTRQGFLSDNPERNPEKDNKGYNNYAKKIADKIKETRHDEAFAIGINGKWGAGKTTMSEFVKDNLKEEKDIITIDFKPWNSNTPDAIIKDFFETLQDELSPYHAALSRLLIRYSRKLTSIDSNIITQTIEYAANYILDLDATNKVYDKINAALKDIDKKIIIYIDDLDRLEQNEIMEVIRLIRNTANFYNSFFIVTYDKDYVNHALKDAKIHNHEKFLEKIFQLEVNLPYYDKIRLCKELEEKLVESFPDKENDIKETLFLDETEVYIYGRGKAPKPFTLMLLDDWINNSRDVTRLCNSIMLNYPRVKDYVVFKEFLLIEVLRINYPSVYYDLYNRRKDFFEEKGSPIKFEFKKEQKSINNKHSGKDIEETPILEYLKQNFQNENDKIFELLNIVFYKMNRPHHPEHQSNHQDSIVRVKRFYIYFNYTNFDKVLASKEFNNAYNSNEEDFFKEIKKWINKDLGIEVSERLGIINNFNNKDDLEKYARALILFYDLFNNNKTLEYFRNKINQKEIIKEFYNGSSEKMIESIFQPFRKNDIRRKLGFIASFDIEEIVIFQDTFLKLFDTLIENSSKFNYEMSYCVHIAYKIPVIKDAVTGRLKNFILENDHLCEFLLSTLCPLCLKTRPVDHINNKYIETFFPNLVEFKELLISRKERSEYVKEYLNFYNECEKVKFKEGYKFDFPFDHFPTIEEWEKGL